MTLGILIELSTTTKKCMPQQEFNYIKSGYSTLKSLIKFLIIIVIFQSPSMYCRRNTIACNIWKLKHRFKYPFKTRINKIVFGFLYYTSLINIILIVITSPSIVNPGTADTGTDINVSYCNAQGLILSSTMRGNCPIFQTNKLLQLQSYLYNTKPEVMIVNETWLNEHIHSNEIVDENFYRIFRLDRSKEDKAKYSKFGGGGLFILVKQELDVDVKLIKINCLEPVLSIELKFKNSTKLCISTFYRYGYSKLDTYHEIEKYYRAISQSYSRIVLVGDLNLGTIKDWDNPTSTCPLESRYLELFQDLGFTSMVNESTHRDGNILDLVLTNQPGIVKNLNIEPDKICNSDHFSVTFKIAKRIKNKKPMRNKIFNYKRADWVGMNDEIRNTDWSHILDNHSTIVAWNAFKSKLDIIMRKYIPMISVKFKKQPHWFDSDIYELCKAKDNLRKRYKRTNLDSDHQAYCELRSKIKQTIAAKKQSFFTDDPCDDTSVINKKIWSYVKSNTKCARIPDSVHYNGRYRSNTLDKCDLFNKFFCDQFSEKSRYDIGIDYETSNMNYYFLPTEIYKLLKKVKPNKAPGPDGISGHILKHCSYSLGRPLSILFNKAYISGVLPDDWKTANVVPIHKKGHKEDIENYRPVSLTSLVMKIFEKCIRVRIYNLCQDKISNFQHGFLPQKSCTTQLIEFSGALSFNLNSKWQTGVIYFDFAKAFDSVNHDVLLNKMKYKFGINGYLLNFLKHYLRGRKQRVTLDGSYSKFAHVDSGVPQGSIIGPLLFVLFINDIVEVLSDGTNILMYADDTKIWRVIHSQNDQMILQEDINKLYDWSVANKIKFHPHKCKVVTVSLLINSLHYNYSMNGTDLEFSQSEKDLGITITKNFKWNSHHRTILSKAGQKLGLMKRTCGFTKNKLFRKILFLTVIRSQFEHASPVWRPTTSTQMNKFEALQKRCVKWVMNEDYSYYSKSEYLSKLESLDILPMYLKFRMNDIIFFHKIVYGSSVISLPSYIISARSTDSHLP